MFDFQINTVAITSVRNKNIKPLKISIFGRCKLQYDHRSKSIQIWILRMRKIKYNKMFKVMKL